MIEIGETTAFDKNSEAHSRPIDKISCHDLTYEQFHNQYMKQNTPLVIESIPHKWKSMETWIKSTERTNSRLDFEYLKQHISNHKAPIADCTKQHLNSHQKFEMDFHDFLDYWAKQMTLEPNCDDRLWYLKDWHLKKLQPGYDFYKIPQYFGSDWLNESHLCGDESDDYKFVYMGPKGTWTPFHSDVFSSFSWSVNIFGAKKWILVYPNEEQKLLDKFGNLPFDVTEEMLRKNNCSYVCLIQNAGDTIFVPSGWHHQVHNIDHTISINHNFFNGCNILQVWLALLDSYRKVLKEIDDCRGMTDFESHCQIMLKALHGMNFEDFFDLLRVIVDSRVTSLRTGSQLVTNEFVLGRNLCVFDLQSCRTVLDTIDFSTNELNFCMKTMDDCNHMRKEINEKLKNCYISFRS